MRTVTQEQFHNAKKLLELMQSLPQSRVNLSTYGAYHECGTIACTLGHAAASGIFKHLGLQMGIKTLFGGVVAQPTLGGDSPQATSAQLFGRDAWSYLFSRRSDSPYDSELAIWKSADAPDISDKTVAIHRLEQWLKHNRIEEQPHGQANTAAI